MFKQNFTGVGLRLRLHFACLGDTTIKKANKIYITSRLAPVCESRHLCIKFVSRLHVLYMCVCACVRVCVRVCVCYYV